MRAIFLDFIRKGGPYFIVHGMYKIYSQMSDRMYYRRRKGLSNGEE